MNNDVSDGGQGEADVKGSELIGVGYSLSSRDSYGLGVPVVGDISEEEIECEW